MRFCYHDYDYTGKKLPTQHYFMSTSPERSHSHPSTTRAG
tara:strand:- start:636 stop:755 length:120 start_codon:yes stop_codon:yes gene_type:complete